MSTASLDRIAVGATAVVRAVRGDGTISARILEMGVVPGATIRLVGTAPLGDPLEFEIHGYRLSLRRAEAALVDVSES